MVVCMYISVCVYIYIHTHITYVLMHTEHVCTGISSCTKAKLGAMEYGSIARHREPPLATPLLMI